MRNPPTSLKEILVKSTGGMQYGVEQGAVETPFAAGLRGPNPPIPPPL